MAQAHASDLWKEPAENGGTPGPVQVYWVKDGADWTVNTTGPEEGALFLVGSDYILCDLTPVLGLYYDSGGNVQAIDPDTTTRLHGIAVRGDFIFY